MAIEPPSLEERGMGEKYLWRFVEDKNPYLICDDVNYDVTWAVLDTEQKRVDMLNHLMHKSWFNFGSGMSFIEECLRMVRYKHGS